MNFSKNLYYLRKRDKITQEELAEQLGVSRQSVSKWEQGEAYPETEKLLSLCDLFHITLDELVRNDLQAAPESTNKEIKNADSAVYLAHMDAFSVKISVGVFLCLFGVSCCVAIGAFSEGLPHADLIAASGAAVLLFFAAIAVFLFVLSGISHGKFRNDNPTIDDPCSEETRNTFMKRFTLAMACLVSAIILDVVLLIVLSSLLEAEVIPSQNKEQSLAYCAAAFLFFLSFIVGGLTYFGIQHTKYHPSEYNGQNEESKKHSERVDGACGVIMMTAAAVYLVLGFVWNLWHPGWVIFPVCGILCGIISTIFKKKS